MTDSIKIARATLDREMEGLKALEKALDEKFSQAVDMIAACKGRAIVSGMGKSGHIANKIASTFSSTGTSSFFVHPAEASHGDLGMITRNDIVILLSNSGETSELRDIIFYCKRFDIPIISIVRRKTSTLVESSSIAFILPEVPEVSSVAAPTTSTTMMLAWGDALAMAVMDKKGFSNDDFGTFHPGGKLGSQFIKVEQLMLKGDSLPVISEDEMMSDVLLIMTRKALGCAAAVDKSGTLLGIITDGDLRRHMDGNITSMKAGDILNRKPKTIKPSMLAIEALGIMNRNNITTLLVCDDSAKLTGIIHIHNLLSAGI